jgi:hypothetical protein
MSDKVDRIVYAARNLVEHLDPEQRAQAGLELQILVRAVEDAHLAEDEPVFCLRGRDKVAVPTIRTWARYAENLGAKVVLCDNARNIAEMFREWQERNRLIAKVPD